MGLQTATAYPTISQNPTHVYPTSLPSKARGSAFVKQDLVPLIQKSATAALKYLEKLPLNQPAAQDHLKSQAGKAVKQVLLGKFSDDSKKLLKKLYKLTETAGCTDKIISTHPFAIAAKENPKYFAYLMKDCSKYLGDDDARKCLNIIMQENHTGRGSFLLKYWDQAKKNSIVLCDGSTTSSAKSPFLKALNSHPEIFKLFIQYIPLDQYRVDGKNILHILVEKKKSAFLQTLLQYRPDDVIALVDQRDAQNETPLYKAAKKNDSIAVNFLIECGANFTKKVHSKTPLSVAKKGSVCEKILKSASKGGFSVNSTIAQAPQMKQKILNRYENCFLKCCEEGDLAEAKKLFKKHDLNIDAVDAAGNNALLLALKARQKKGLDVNSFMDFLIRKKINVKHVNGAGEDAFTLALEKEHYSFVKLLIEDGHFDINSLTLTGKNALFIMVESRARPSSEQENMIKFLLDNSIDLTHVCDGETILTRAAQLRSDKFCLFILEWGTNIKLDQLNGSGKSFIEVAAKKGLVDLIDELAQNLDLSNDEHLKKAILKLTTRIRKQQKSHKEEIGDLEDKIDELLVENHRLKNTHSSSYTDW
jgi:ankyrin repeat protein